MTFTQFSRGASAIRELRSYFDATKELDSRKPSPLALPYSRLYSLWKSYANPDARFLFAGLYLGGQRIGEFCQVRRADVDLKWENGRPYVVIDSVTEKSRASHFRSLAIPMNRRDSELANFFWNRVKQIDNPEGRIWPLTDRSARNYLAVKSVSVTAMDFNLLRYITIELKIHPHYLRHCRATHLVSDFNFGFLQLKKYFGWTNNAMPDLYTNLAWQDIAREYEKTEGREEKENEEEGGSRG